MTYRPWGPIDWALSLSSQKKWYFVGVIGTEERSICSWAYMRDQGLIHDELFAEISDVDSDKYRERIRIALETRRNEFSARGGNLTVIHKFDLMVELFKILAFSRQIESAAPSIILDITAFPKRFFFVILRTLLNSSYVENLVITYTSPASYANDEPLYEDIEPWRTLPGFGGAASGKETWIVSVGFMVESLRQYVGDNPNHKMNLIMPFPAPLAALRRTWESIADLDRNYSDGRFEKYRVDPLDMSDTFERIKSLGGGPSKALAFAPFGPKPTSAAMCLYAIQKDSSVHYPQPTVYHPNYSIGIRNNDPKRAVCAYWVKHEGENLYVV